MSILAVTLFGYTTTWTALAALAPLCIGVAISLLFVYYFLFWSLPVNANGYFPTLKEIADEWRCIVVAHFVGLAIAWIIWAGVYCSGHHNLISKLQ